MPEIVTLVDIQDLTESTSTDGGMFFAVAVPSGGGYLLRKLSKENLLKIESGDTIDFNASDGKLMNLPSSGSMSYQIGAGILFDSNRLGIGFYSPLGPSVFSAYLKQDGSLVLADDGYRTFYGKDLMQRFIEVELNENGSVPLLAAKRSCAKILPTGGSITNGTINLPESPRDTDFVDIYISGSVTNLVIDTPGPETIDTAITTANNTRLQYYYSGTDTEWKYMPFS